MSRKEESKGLASLKNERRECECLTTNLFRRWGLKTMVSAGRETRQNKSRRGGRLIP